MNNKPWFLVVISIKNHKGLQVSENSVGCKIDNILKIYQFLNCRSTIIWTRQQEW